ncbi:MAG TPA: hypothetical protein VII52_16360 [Gemmatimonadaceae bacterium]
MRCPTFVVLAGYLLVAGSARMADAQATTRSAAIGAVTITVNGRSHAGKFQSVEGIALLAERPDVEHLSGRLGKPTADEPAAVRLPAVAKPTTFAIVVSMSDPVGVFIAEERQCLTTGDTTPRCLFDATLTIAGGTFVAHGARLTALVLPPAGQATGKATPPTVKATFVARSLSRQ